MARVLVVDDDPDRVTGIELLHAIRADPATAQIAFVLLTARAHDVTEPEIDGFVSKPFSLGELSDGVDAALARRA